MELKARVGTIFLNWDPPKKVIKVSFKTCFNSTMMASFLPVIVSKKDKLTQENIYFIAVSHKFT